MKNLILSTLILASATSHKIYREAGDAGRPNVVLLHGFPTSSHMYRELIPRLATKYHVVAPDFPGFGYSSQPKPEEFEYSFAKLTELTDRFLDQLGIQKYSIYVQDYGSPVGFRLFAKHPERSAANEAKVRKLLTLETTKFQYSAGFRKADSLSPDAWVHAQAVLDRPGNDVIQLALFL